MLLLELLNLLWNYNIIRRRMCDCYMHGPFSLPIVYMYIDCNLVTRIYIGTDLTFQHSNPYSYIWQNLNVLQKHHLQILQDVCRNC